MKILGIETTCDETAVSVVENGSKVLENIVFSQIEIHQKFGGVFPEYASRSHLPKLLPLIEKAVKNHSIDAIAVANGPGLMGSLLIGVSCAKTLAICWNKPIVGVNHVEAHIYSSMMDVAPVFPALGVVLSGGHTFLAKMMGTTTYEILSTTVDDALGEAFDKVAALLNLPYPGGPQIEKLAKNGDPYKYPFKSGFVKKNPLNFSFSGLKTNVLYSLKGPNSSKHKKDIIKEDEKKHIAASFQHIAVNDVVSKIEKATKLFNCKGIYMGGGVTQNSYLKNLVNELPFPIFWPKPGLSVDNAAMIAGLAFHLIRDGNFDDDVNPFTRHF